MLESITDVMTSTLLLHIHFFTAHSTAEGMAALPLPQPPEHQDSVGFFVTSTCEVLLGYAPDFIVMVVDLAEENCVSFSTAFMFVDYVGHRG